MAVTFATGFEAQQAATDGVTLTGTAAYSTGQQRTGAASVRCNPASGASGYLTTTLAVGFHHFGLYIATAPTVERIIWGAAGVSRLTLNGTTLTLYDSSGNSIGTCSITASAWHWLGIRATNSAATGDFLQIDGSSAITGTNKTVSGLNASLGFRGTESSAGDIYVDDWIVDGNPGGFLGPSNVDIAFPAGDDLAGGATDGNGGTSNLWECVNNIPPAGVATGDEPTNPAVNLRFASGAIYRANHETLTSLGIDTSVDTLLAYRAVMRHGEDISTGTKTGTYSISGHGTTQETVTFGDNAGAHAAESGTPLWKVAFGTLWTDDLVGETPQVTVSRAVESRVGCVDFMGALIVWTPASGPPTEDAPAELATTTGAGQTPKANPAAAPAQGTVTGAAYAATTVAEKRVAAELATATAEARAPSDQVRFGAGVGAVTSAAQTAIANEGAPAGLATVTDAAQTPSARPEARAQAGVATVADAAFASTARPEARAAAALAAVTDAAQAPTVLTGAYAPAGLATVTDTGQTPIAAERVSAGLATVAGAAQTPTVTLGTFAPAGLATVAGAAQTSTGVGERRAPAELATATATTTAATAFGERRVDAALAAATAATPAPIPADASIAAVATATDEARVPTAAERVSADAATVAVAGYDSTVEIATNETQAHAALADVAILANDASAFGERRVSAPVATAATSAPGPLPADAMFAPTTNVPATAQTSTGNVGAVAPSSPVTTTAQVAAGVAVRLAPAALAQVTSTGQVSADRVHTFVTNATVEISAYDATVNTSSAVQAPADLATIATTAYDGIAALAVKPSAAAATGAAQSASGRAEKRPQPDAATVTTTANDAIGVGERRAPAAVGTVAAAAQAATGVGGRMATAGLGTIAVVDRTPAIQIRVWADLATTSVTANDASVTTSSSVNAQAGLASATTAAYASVTAIAPMSALATITTAAQAPSVFLRVAPATAIVQATGLAAPGGIGAIAPSAPAMIATAAPSFMLAIHADLAAILATALAPEIGNPPIFLSPSTGMQMPIGATMNPSSGSRLVGR